VCNKQIIGVKGYKRKVFCGELLSKKRKITTNDAICFCTNEKNIEGFEGLHGNGI
jgi:hypothetical protein